MANPNNIIWAKPDGNIAVTAMTDPNADAKAHAPWLLASGLIDTNLTAVAFGVPLAAGQEEYRWQNGALVHVGPPPPPVPQQVTNMQAKVALSRAGLLTNATNWINTQSAEDQLIWNSTPVFSRNSALLAAAATALSMDASAVDKLFILATTINP